MFVFTTNTRILPSDVYGVCH